METLGKRIVILCDGTWNAADAPDPTNVVRLGQAVAGVGDDGMHQVCIYVEGVGTGRRGVTGIGRKADRLLGGALGMGLMDNVAEAYRHLVFLHEPGDEILVFGFSRGAFTARSLVGLLRYTGLLSRTDLHLLPEAVARYTRPSYTDAETRQARNVWWRAEHAPHLIVDDRDPARLRESDDPDAPRLLDRIEHAIPLNVAYLGVWDTVGALGVPGWVTAAPLLNRRHQFHDTDLSPFVMSARHAVALDERRRSFEPTLWTNLPELNDRARARLRDPSAEPYRELWMAGDHGAVGGGGDIQDLSAIALDWIMEGAEATGLTFLPGLRADVRAARNPMGPLANRRVPAGGPVSAVMRRLGRDRPQGPRGVEGVHAAARDRWAFEGKGTGWRPYRPGTLAAIEGKLAEWHRRRLAEAEARDPTHHA